ncbi:MAG: FecR domain-containing protein [Tissierellia bacterium]|nr:FecR domain-containing protein [Tissierellia bacterium]
MRKENTDFVRFLKEETFIEWKLFPTDELDVYWNEFIKNHPEEWNNIEMAEKHFRKVNISSHKIPPEVKRDAIKRMEHSIQKLNRKRNIRRFTYAAVACAVVLVLSLLYIQKAIDHSEQDFIASTDYIVGNELDSEDILFISGDKTASFHKNISIAINGDRVARVRSELNEDKQISLEQNTRNKLIVPYGKRSEIVLSDGTRAWLNSGSILEFPSVFSGNTREVFLSGEMYIEVAADKRKSFYVHTSGYKVKVYGTKFNISNYPGSPSSVVLVEGSVALQSAEKKELFLLPEEQALYSEETGAFDTRKVDVNSFISWKNGYLSFEDTPMIEALKQIERYYNLSFNFGDDVSFHGLTCTGKIILSDNLDNVMTALTLISSTNYKYKKENRLIYIYKEY